MSKFSHFNYPRDIEKSLKELKNSEPQKFEKLGEEKAIKLAEYTRKSTKAYQKYLKENNFKGKITQKNFHKLPLTSKEDYLKKSEYKDLFPKNELEKVTTISSTSGSTGEPFYFPRGEEQDKQYEYVAEVFLKNQFDIEKKTTLAINGFGLGIWIGGIYTYKNFNMLAQKGYKISMAPVGTNKEIYLKTLQKQSKYYDQILLMGYPPFVKDILDEASDYGIDLSKKDVKILMATEGFSEKFREYLIRKAGIKNPVKDIINIYGSVEFGTMSNETSLSVLIRRIATKNREVFKAIFGNASLLPTLVQYYPHIVYFEQLEDEVLATGMGSSFPLVRYKFHDRGGVITFNDMVDRLNSVGVDILKEAGKLGLEDDILKLPFVYVYERSDFVLIIKGANVYPENIKKALQISKLEAELTGRFTMQKMQTDDLDDYLLVNIEVRKNVKPTKRLESKVEKLVLKSLLKNNSEFKNSYNFSKTGSMLEVKLRSYEDNEYFSRNVIKHKWVMK